MPQSMHRAACLRRSLVSSGSVNSRKCRMRSPASWYFCSCRSYSRKPVTLPIVSSVSCPPRNPGGVGVGPVWSASFEAAPSSPASPVPRPCAKLSPSAEDPCLFGRHRETGALHFLQGPAILHRHHFHEFRPIACPVVEDRLGASRPRIGMVVRDELHQPFLVGARHVGEDVDAALGFEIAAV